jgi:hypothetical protein
MSMFEVSDDKTRVQPHPCIAILPFPRRVFSSVLTSACPVTLSLHFFFHHHVRLPIHCIPSKVCVTNPHHKHHTHQCRILISVALSTTTTLIDVVFFSGELLSREKDLAITAKMLASEKARTQELESWLQSSEEQAAALEADLASAVEA